VPRGYDVVIAGAGSAGCVLASRLSEDAARRVLLLEAGPDHPADQLPPDIANGWEVAYAPDWGFVTEPDALGRSINAWRGRLVGGCSALNATIALRGHPRDYDAWAELGNNGWTFQELLPFFRRIETDADFQDEWHGTDGPLPLRRYQDENLSPLQVAFMDAARTLGWAHVADHNQPGAVGVGRLPTNTRADGLRMSCALTYLALARERPNLEIRSQLLVDRVVVSNGRCRGVLTAEGELVEADLVVLAAGAYGSPALLLRGGIGPGTELHALGIEIHHELSGVGRGLRDHPLNAIDLQTSLPVLHGPKYQVMLTGRTNEADPDGPPDYHIFPAGPFDGAGYSPTGAVQALVLSVMKPQSEGWVRLRSADPTLSPRIHLGLLEHPDDTRRMVEVLRLARGIAREAALQAVIAGAELAPGEHIGDQDEAALQAALKGSVNTYHHPVGSCRMGPDPASGAVVDDRARVHGIDNLRVADASIMPEIPSTNTNLPTLMIAERIAACIQNEDRA